MLHNLNFGQKNRITRRVFNSNFYQNFFCNSTKMHILRIQKCLKTLTMKGVKNFIYINFSNSFSFTIKCI